VVLRGVQAVRFLSLFSGIEAASHSWGRLGWEAVGFSEIDAFACALLAHHYPDVPNLGDVSRITREQVEALGPIDLVCGGFPCQDLSVAGKRAGLKDADGNATRSGLFFDAMRVVGWARARWLVVENVPGMLSSHRGRDFAAVVGAMAGCEFDVPPDGWGNSGAAVGPLGLVEWRTLDAQFFGLAQRRKRVFLVRDSGDWAGRSPVLLEPEGLRGDSAPSRSAGARVAASLTRGAESSGRGGYAGRRQEDDINIVAGSLGTSGPGAGWRIGPDEAAAHQVIAIQGSMLGRAVTAGPAGSGINEEGTSFTLTKTDVHAVALCLNAKGGGGRLDGESETLIPTTGAGFDVAHALRADGFDASEDGTGRGTPLVAHSMPGPEVRRLTPTECEVLQGFSPGYTAVPYRGKPAADGPRYKALGNSWACNVSRWIGERIAERAAA
jgi:DNA (cytosine-5)-methyltransferase 1